MVDKIETRTDYIEDDGGQLRADLGEDINRMMDESQTPSAETMEKLAEAREKYAPIVELPLSPSGWAVNLARDTPIFGKSEEYVLKAGIWPLSRDLTLLSFDVDKTREDLARIKEEARVDGRLDEYVDEKGSKVSEIKTGDGPVTLSMSLTEVKLDGAPVHLTEVFASAAIYSQETEEDVRRLISELYRPAQDDGIMEVKLAQYSITGNIVDSSLALKALRGLVAIAHGAPSVEIQPERGKSRESYKVTASYEPTNRFFIYDGGNIEELKLITETVHTLKTEKCAEGLIHEGRIWFTTNKILTEITRTESGADNDTRHSKKKELVDDGLLAMSSLQIVGTDPAGNPLNVAYFMNAERREKVVFNGNEYRDVWGFNYSSRTISDYADELGQTHKYPLIKGVEKMTVQQAAVRRYLTDKLHEYRHRVYTSTGNPSKKSGGKCTDELSWETIFQTFSPLVPLEYRQKRRLVRDFDLILNALAIMDSKGELHEGRPMSLMAYSTRKKGVGSGRGAWDKLIISCTAKYHVPKVNLL